MSHAILSKVLLSTGLTLVACIGAVAQEANDDASPKQNKPQVNQQRVADLTELILAQPHNEKGYRLRALEYARGAAWGPAAADWRKLIEFAPDDSQRCQQTGVLIVMSQDVKSYQKHCRMMTERFADSSDPGDLERTVKMCTLAPMPQGDLEELTKMAERSVELSKGRNSALHHARTLALVHYRNRKYAQALAAVAQSDKRAADSTWTRGHVLASNRAIEALCKARRGNTEDAEKALAAAGEILDKKFAHAELVYTDRYWHDWLIANILRDEARQLLAGGGMGEVRWGHLQKPAPEKTEPAADRSSDDK